MGYCAIDRRKFLAGAGIAAAATRTCPRQAIAQEAVPASSGTQMQRRIRGIIHGFEEQGFTALEQPSIKYPGTG